MPGAWEISKTILCGMLHVETATIAWALGLRNLKIPGPLCPVSGMTFDHGRNTICMRALESGADYCGMLDTDVIPPHDAFLRLMAHDLPIVSGVYCRRAPPHGVPVMLKDGKWIMNLPKDSMMEVDLVGAGCLLIRRDVLEKFQPLDPRRGKHWFDWRSDCTGVLPPGECVSEDFSFCQGARRQGYKIMVDTSIQCRHVGYSEVTFGQMKPIEHTPNT